MNEIDETDEIPDTELLALVEQLSKLGTDREQLVRLSERAALAILALLAERRRRKKVLPPPATGE